MSDSVSSLPANPSLEQLQKQAKELLKRYFAGERVAIQRFQANLKEATFADAQFVIASEHGFPSWAKLKHHIGALSALRIEQYEQLARDLAAAHMSADSRALRALNRSYGTEFMADFHHQEEMQRRLLAGTRPIRARRT